MSYSELFKMVNNNPKKPLNEQIRDYMLMPGWLFTGTTAFTPPVAGVYRVICIGSGANGSSSGGGAAGGVAVGILNLEVQTYSLTVGQDALFDTVIGAYGANFRTAGDGFGGTVYKGADVASGNFNGGDVAIYMLGRGSTGGNSGKIPGASSSVYGFGGGGGGFGGGGGCSVMSGNGGYGGAGFAGGSGGGFFGVYDSTNGIFPTMGAGLGGGQGSSGNNSSRTHGQGGAAAVIIEFIAEV
jgi:hypothetical protein